jgi:ribonuclease E
VARIQKKTCHVTIRLAPAVTDGAAARRPRTTEDTAVEPEAQPAEEPKAEEKPRRASRSRKPATAKAEAAEKPKAKPKPKRAPRKKKTEGEES